MPEKMISVERRLVAGVDLARDPALNAIGSGGSNSSSSHGTVSELRRLQNQG